MYRRKKDSINKTKAIVMKIATTKIRNTNIKHGQKIILNKK